MKEKRPSRPLSLWAYPGLLIVVLVSCGLFTWFSGINPLAETTNLHDQYIYWESSTQTLSFFGNPIGRFYASSPRAYYSLDLQGHLVCVWTRNMGYGMAFDRYDPEPPTHSFTPEQLAAYEKRYGPIRGYDVINSDVTVLVTDSTLLWRTLYEGRLVVINNARPESDIVIDSLTLYWTNIVCDHQQPYLILNTMVLFAVVATVVKATRRMRYKNMWLLAYGVAMVLGVLFMDWLATLDH